jgi:indolepyruvate ferredoxin oxidoreductase
MRWLRYVMPQWHRSEREFRDWYIRLVENFHYDDRASYDHYVKALRCVEEVRGYREIRYPKMEEMKRKVEELLREEPPIPTRATVNV